ncbi:MAG: carboxypeptidase regulatory-like domain-containing protein [Acidobacteria bacterium]|nr:carboxypeptidase regulatory-like domain-containing protein [Acidobacteriota bacterium]
MATGMARAVSVLGLILFTAGAGAAAQLSTAELNGRVTDSSGAVLPGATVTATQTATGVERSVVTDAAGSYVTSTGGIRPPLRRVAWRTSTPGRSAASPPRWESRVSCSSASSTTSDLDFEPIAR